MAQFVDFVGLNTFIYEPVGWNPEEQVYPDGFVQLSGYEGIPFKFPQDFGVSLWRGIGYFAKQHLNHIGSFENTNAATSLGIEYYLNNTSSFYLPSTASGFPSLMLRRSGPYGYSSFNQIRVGHNACTRKQRENSIFTHVIEPGQEVFPSGDMPAFTSRYGEIKLYIESPVVSKFKPLEVKVGIPKASAGLKDVIVKGTYGNNTNHFSNFTLDKYYGLVNCGDENYEKIKNMYLNNNLASGESPAQNFKYLKYREVVYPPEVYTSKVYTRKRNSFSFNWRSSRTNRTITSTQGTYYGDIIDTDNGFGTNGITSSMWPLDVAEEWGTEDDIINVHYSGSIPKKIRAWGILQNDYNMVHNGMVAKVDLKTADSYIRLAPTYNRKHFLLNSASVVSKNGMKIEGVNYGTGYGNITLETTVPQGEAAWDAGSQANRYPFFDSYDKFSEYTKLKGQGYTIVPEFRISSHVAKIEELGPSADLDALFEMKGGREQDTYPKSFTTSSNADDFFKIYSNSDFLKHFDLVKQEHKDFTKPRTLKLTCKVIKKFLPYDGFYPCQRVVDLAKQFYSSYKDGTSVAYGSDTSFTSSLNHGFQNLMAPLFAPGVLMNTIKSGIACDYPTISGTLSAGSPSSNVYEHQDDVTGLVNFFIGTGSTGDIFDKRIPFEAIVRPEKYMADSTFGCMEPDARANVSSSATWDGSGDNLYKKMAHNFLSEVPSFFLRNGQYTKIASKPSKNRNVGNAVAGNVYIMRVNMFKTVSGSILPTGHAGAAPYERMYMTPQYPDGAEENFTMYSRPSAFGPPVRALYYTGAGDPIISGSFSDNGENYPFTPPYYYGQAWADIKFEAAESKKYSIQEIVASSSVKYYRFVNTGSIVTGVWATNEGNKQTIFKNQDAMQLSASLNLFSLGEIKTIETGGGRGAEQVSVAVDVSDDDNARWIIHPKFETPMMNFSHLSESVGTIPSSDLITMPTYGSQSVPRGMWHQYGKIEEDTSKGIFLKVSDIPTNFAITAMTSSIGEDIHSLADLVGFTQDTQRLGKVASSKVIREAIVAIPFVENQGERRFFGIPRDTIIRYNSLLNSGAALGAADDRTIYEMIYKMNRYVFPPKVDFMNNPDIDPFAMYIFEFKHSLDSQDLANIWQNILPDIGTGFQTSTAEISHGFLFKDMLTGAGIDDNNPNKQGMRLPDRIKWMVFKVKQKAKTNYWDTVVGEEKIDVDFSFTEGLSVDMEDQNIYKYSYNWPYDYFSLVELAKIEAEIEFGDAPYVPPDEPPAIEGIYDFTYTGAITDGTLASSVGPTWERTEIETEIGLAAAAGTLPTAEDSEALLAGTSRPSGFNPIQGQVGSVLTNMQTQQEIQNITQGAGPGMGPINIQDAAMAAGTTQMGQGQQNMVQMQTYGANMVSNTTLQSVGNNMAQNTQNMQAQTQNLNIDTSTAITTMTTQTNYTSGY